MGYNRLYYLLCVLSLLFLILQFCALEDQSLPAELSLGSPLLTTFQELLLSVYINVLSLLEFTLSGLEYSEQLMLCDQLHGVSCVYMFVYILYVILPS